jgi:branched-chain amino acid transport system permease protein
LVVNSVISNWTDVTHGTGGLSVAQSTTRNGALAWAAVTIVVAYLLQSSTLGLRLRGAREDEVAARAVGIRIARDRGIAFVVSCFFLGVGGALIAGQLGSFAPSAFSLSITFLTVAMLVVGGMTSLAGAVFGTIVLSVLSEGLRRVESTTGVSNLQELGFAVVLLGILLLRPAGITGGRELRLSFRQRRTSAGPS